MSYKKIIESHSIANVTNIEGKISELAINKKKKIASYIAISKFS